MSAPVLTNHQGEEDFDLTFNLPDELLLKVLSCLTLKEAVKTSPLSTRWKHLWKSANLDFDALDELFAITKLEQQAARDSLDEKRQWYVNWVNSVITQLQQHDDNNNNDNNASNPTTFKLRFDLDNGSNSQGDIDRWVRFAISKRVESIEVSFHLTGVKGSSEKISPFVFLTNDCYGHIKTPAGLSDIKALRSLRLSCVDVRDEILEHFLANCPLLEELAIKRLSSLTKLRVVGTCCSLRWLTYLEVRVCMELETLEIGHAPRLSRLVYGLCPRVEELRVVNCPRLLELTMNMAYLLLTVVPEYATLERLAVEVDGPGTRSVLGQLVQYVNASPRLHTLQLFLHINDDGSHQVDVPEGIVVDKKTRESIKVVEIFGFSGYDMECELIDYVMEYFVGLEKIVLDRGLTTPYSCDGYVFGGKISNLCTREQGEKAKRIALEYKSMAPPNLEFIVI
ncbi:Putative F-box/LRR-repeat protein At3g42770 [Linum perenne]